MTTQRRGLKAGSNWFTL